MTACSSSKKARFAKNSMLLRKILSIESVLPQSFHHLVIANSTTKPSVATAALKRNQKKSKLNLMERTKPPFKVSDVKKSTPDLSKNQANPALTKKLDSSVDDLSSVMSELNRAKSIETLSTVYIKNSVDDVNVDLFDDETLRTILVCISYKYK